MSIVFVASEVGSVRALLPVCDFCCDQGLPVSVFNIGYMEDVSTNDWNLIEHEHADVDNLCRILEDNNAKLLVFSVNVGDVLPLQIARAAQKLGIPTIHILDYWNMYLDRLQLDNGEVFKPSVYVVPDEYARQKAILEGVDDHIVRVTGQPAFADMPEQYRKAGDASVAQQLRSFNLDEAIETVIFVSEPVANDQGTSLQENDKYRGYTEKETLKIFLDALRQSKQSFQALILPHPREDGRQVRHYWAAIGGEPYGQVITNIRGRDLLPLANAVVGMSSTLLYEAWLLNKPVLSIQPELRNDSLRMIGERDGVMLIDKREGAEERALAWLEQCDTSLTSSYRPELDMHRHAVEQIYRLIRNLTH